jgi:hypothetical protein
VNEDPLKKSDSLGINGQALEALQRGDLESVIWTLLLEQTSDPVLATLMKFMYGRDHPGPAGPAGLDDAGTQPGQNPDPLLATLMTLMQGRDHLGPAGTAGLEEAGTQAEADSDPVLTTLMNLMHGQDHPGLSGTAGPDEARTQAEPGSDPLLATLMNLMHGQDHPGPAGTAGLEDAEGRRLAPPYGLPDVAVTSSENGQPDAARATLRRVALMLGACPACCGEETSCPECHGSGKPGSVPSTASAHELRAWIEPALGRMGMLITNPALSAAAT